MSSVVIIINPNFSLGISHPKKKKKRKRKEKKAAASVIKCLLFHNQQLFLLKFSAISDTVKAAEEILTQSCIIFC